MILNDTTHYLAIPAPHLESCNSDESLGAKKAKGLDSPCSIHFHSVRKRLTDSDGISAKAAIDGLVHAGLLEDDSPKFVKTVSYSQEKTKDVEYTEIILD